MLNFHRCKTFFLFCLLALSAQAEEGSDVVAAGKLVSFTYTLTVEGEVQESNADQAPLTYIQGSQQILPALEQGLEGLSAGNSKTIELAAADAYGESMPDRIQEIPLEQLPEPSRTVGAMVQAEGFPGPIRVVEIREDVAVLDFNHPLAGKDLTFDVTVVSVEDAPAAPANAAPVN